MQNQAKWIFSGLGAFWAGGTLVPLDYKLTAPEQLALLEHCKPRVLVTEYSRWLELSKLDAAPLEKVLVLVTEAPEGAGARQGAALGASRGRTGSSIASARATTPHASSTRRGRRARPKGCMLSHDNYLEQAEVLGRPLPDRGGRPRTSRCCPTNHAIDFMVGLHRAAALRRRGRAPANAATRSSWRATMKRYGSPTSRWCPTILKNLEKRIEERLDELPSLAAPRGRLADPGQRDWATATRAAPEISQAGCSSRSTTSSAVSCGSSSPAAPSSTARWRSSSTTSACRS